MSDSWQSHDASDGGCLNVHSSVPSGGAIVFLSNLFDSNIVLNAKDVCNACLPSIGMPRKAESLITLPLVMEQIKPSNQAVLLNFRRRGENDDECGFH
jgi:hypothetical protein